MDVNLAARSPFGAALNTNYVPSECDCQIIEGYLAVLQSQVSKLENQLLVHQGSEEEILQQLEERSLSIDAHRALLTLARRLPDELLREIFLHSLPSNHNATFCPEDSPILLTRVSQRWRAVALSTPRLWSTLHIPILSELDGFVLFTQRDVMVKEWMARAGSTPISLSFGTGWSSFFPNLPYLSRLFAIASPTYSTWEDIAVSLSGHESELLKFTELLEIEGRNPFRRARKLEINIDMTSAFRNNSIDLILDSMHIEDNPRLKALSLSTSFTLLHPLQSMKGSLPWSNLESLKLQPSKSVYNKNDVFKLIMCDVLLDVLAHCPKLKLLDASCAQLREWPSQGQEAVALPELKHASLSFPNLQDLRIIDFLMKCDWPALSSLDFRVRMSEGPVHTLSALVYKLGSKLTSLRFIFPDMPKGYLSGLLRELPNLLQLCLHHSNSRNIFELDSSEDDDSDDGEILLDDDLLAVLIPKEPEVDQELPCACPLLQYLRVEGGASFSRDGVLDLLQSRFRSPFPLGPLKQLYISFGKDTVCHGLEEQCAEMIAAGLDLQLVYHTSDKVRQKYSRCIASLPIDEDPLAFGWARSQ
ncbi:hypothetical protein DFP72DRAFT_976126 [Ephemerocybe angulata]|uniref:F-box domain-containing protein n=1 Tax=Ephemerocybe angulata TaxID=980116 RepID=A0A8H6HCW2_9AGAR|nr:hypothetical protein DFP72DRAFT_976126 [Tulosesus angulatus]